MTIKVGINGFGRIGRLVLRAAWTWDEIEFIHINDPGGNPETFAHLLNFDSTHGIWQYEAQAEQDNIRIENKTITCSHHTAIESKDWSQCDVVIEASGKMCRGDLLQAYLKQGVKRVVVSAPVKETDIPNIVLGVNEDTYDKSQHRIVTAASCTTNCLAPIVKVIHESLRIKHGSITTIHDITLTQSILDSNNEDLRRARACGTNLIPTTTGSATAITHIFPELKGKLDGHAVRIPVTNASITDCVFEVEQATNAEAVNALFQRAAEQELKNILGYEERPLVSTDYKTDPRSSIIDALSTLVINQTQVKVYAWYDNEWAYANRTAELTRLIGLMDQNI